jgi:hypothetical protein
VQADSVVSWCAAGSHCHQALEVVACLNTDHSAAADVAFALGAQGLEVQSSQCLGASDSSGTHQELPSEVSCLALAVHGHAPGEQAQVLEEDDCLFHNPDHLHPRADMGVAAEEGLPGMESRTWGSDHYLLWQTVVED